MPIAMNFTHKKIVNCPKCERVYEIPYNSYHIGTYEKLLCDCNGVIHVKYDGKK